MTSPQQLKGAAHERAIYAYLADQLGADIVKRPRVTTADVGDIHAGPVAIEAKCYPKDPLRAIRDALNEAPAAAVNAGLPFGVGCVKRPGVTDPSSQLVVMTLDVFTRLLREAL